MIVSGCPNAGIRVAVILWTTLSAIIALSNGLIVYVDMCCTLLILLLVMTVSYRGTFHFNLPKKNLICIIVM